VRAQPYRVTLQRGASTDIQIHVRNFRDREQAHRIEIHAPTGLTAAPPVLQGKLEKHGAGAFTVRLSAASDAPSGVAIVGLDTTLDGQRYGEWFDFMVRVE